MNPNPSANLRNDAPSVTKGPRIREAAFEDYDQIAALQVEYDRPIKPYEEWKHLWSNNPAYLRFHNDLAIGWVLETADKKIVGYLGNIPLLYEFGGRRLLACAGHATVVKVRYRPYSVALFNLYFSQKKVDLFVNSTIGPTSFALFSVFQSPRVPVGEWDRSLFWITNGQGFSAAWLEEKAIPLAKPLSYGLALGLAVKETLSNRSFSHNGTGPKLQLCNEIDGRFDIFWESLKKNNSHLLLGVRTREVLEWHFRYPLRNNEAWILTAGTDPAIAYAIFLRYDNPKAALTRMRLVDYQALDGSPALLEPMLLWALEKCRSEGIHMLEGIGFRPEKTNVMTKLAPYERQLPCWLYFYKTRDQSLADELGDPNVWDPAQFDGDASL
jgi:hypothetical protein